MPVLHTVSSSLSVIHTYHLDTVSPARRLRLLFTSKNAVKLCSVIKITNALLCTHGFYSYTANSVDYLRDYSGSIKCKQLIINVVTLYRYLV